MQYTVVSPLTGNYDPQIALPGGFGIEANPISTLPLDLQYCSPYVLNLARSRSYCLRVNFECDERERAKAMEEKVFMAWRIITALQVELPTGWDGVTIGFENQSVGLDANRPWEYWSQQFFPPKYVDFLRAEFQSGCASLVQAILTLTGKSQRLDHAMQYLEAGLQLGQEYSVGRPFRQVPTLLWTFGLDGLLQAEKEDSFSDRLVRLLGGSPFVFPYDDAGCQPAFEIASTAKDLYVWRGFLAHGNRVKRAFWEPKFTCDDVERSSIDCWNYQEVLRDAAIFLLIRSLQVIFLNIGQAVESRYWKRYLDGKISRDTLKADVR